MMVSQVCTYLTRLQADSLNYYEKDAPLNVPLRQYWVIFSLFILKLSCEVIQKQFVYSSPSTQWRHISRRAR
jgi:hypothetical protein